MRETSPQPREVDRSLIERIREIARKVIAERRSEIEALLAQGAYSCGRPDGWRQRMVERIPSCQLLSCTYM
jgi:hypothetical protein